MVTRSRSLVLVTLLLSFVLPSFGWDEAGHKTVAYIAWQKMTPAAREKVFKTLLEAPEDSMIPAYYMSYGSQSEESRRQDFFMLMSTWADFIKDRNLTVRNRKYSVSNWHYTDTFWEEKNGQAVPVTTSEAPGLALNKIVDFDKTIRGTAKDAEKAIAIAWLIHLVGDIHQPLHTSARVTAKNPKGDQGGNLFYLTPKGTPRENQVNLHSFWDGILRHNEPNSKDLCDADYLFPIANAIMKKHPYEKIRPMLADASFTTWVNESYKLATTEVYKGLTLDEMPSKKYTENAFKIGQERMALAGYRLADLFNKAFGGAQ